MAKKPSVQNTKKTPYAKTQDTSKAKWYSTTHRLHQTGLTAKEILEKDKKGNYVIDDKQLKSIFHPKTKSIKSWSRGFRANVKSIQLDKNRKLNVRDNYVDNLKKQGYSGRGLTQQKSLVNRTIGMNSFFDVAKSLQKNSPTPLSKKDSYIVAKRVITQASYSTKGLKQWQKDSIQVY